jgi:antitoxin YefM
MYSTYRLNINELDTSFIKSVKRLFKDKEIEIAIYEVDETEYLLSSPENKKKILLAVSNVNKKKNLMEMKLEDLK